MSELWEKELEHEEHECCDECGNELQNGESYYAIGYTKICEDCMNNHRRIMDYDAYTYTYQDYLVERYERERHDVE